MVTTDKVQAGNSTTTTSTSTTWHCPYTPSKAEQGWECPRCGRINAPWKSQCDCGRNNYWTVTDGWIYKPYNDEWWKHVYCDSDTFKIHPETTTWKAPSSVCTSDSNTYKVDGTTTAQSANSAIDTGGSDYWNSVTRNWENVPSTLTNKIESNKEESEPVLRVQTPPEEKQQETTLDDAYNKFCKAVFEREDKKQEKKQKKTGKYFRD